MNQTGEQAVLERGLRTLQRASRLPLAFGGKVANDQSHFVISSLHGLRTTSLAQLRVASGEGLGGKVLATRRPILVEDYFQESTITRRYDRACAPEGLRTVLSIPIISNATRHAVVYLSSRQQVSVSDRTIDGLHRLAGEIGREIHIENEVTRRLAAHQPTVQAAQSAPLFDELAHIAASSADPDTRARLEQLIAASSAISGPTPQTTHSTTKTLTARETEVLRLVEFGFTNAQIANECGLEVNTVKAYMKSAISKTGATNRIQAARAARNAGWLS